MRPLPDSPATDVEHHGGVTNSEGKMEDLYTLGNLIIGTSLCPLGGTAPNHALSAMNYCKDEYIAHIVDKECPAGVCCLFYVP